MEKEADEGQAEKSLASLDIPGFPHLHVLVRAGKGRATTQSRRKNSRRLGFSNKEFFLFFSFCIHYGVTEFLNKL